MWSITLRDDSVLDEQTLKYWDKVPMDAEIRSLSVTYKRLGSDLPFVTLSGYDAYCCARIGLTTAHSSLIAGYSILCLKGNRIHEVNLMPQTGVQINVDATIFNTCHPLFNKKMWRVGVPYV